MEKINKKDSVTMGNVVKRFGGKRAGLYPLTIALSVLFGIMSIAPYYFIWKIIRQIILFNGLADPSKIKSYALGIFITQIIGLFSSFASLMASHGLAFRIERNIRSQAVAHLLKLPVGFFQRQDTGRLRRLIDDNASKTHGFIAHVFPDLISGLTVPVCLIALVLFVDIRFGILCILGVVFAFINMRRMLTDEAADIMQKYMSSSEMLTANGVEYIRGMPVVKVFNQTVESFQRFYDAIMQYDYYVKFFVNYSRKPMLLYTLSLFAPTILMGPLAMILMGGSETPLNLLVNSIFYVMVSMLFYGALMRATAVSEAKNILNVTMGKLDFIFKEQPMKKEEHEEKKEEGIVFDKVTFTYPEKLEPALKQIQIHFEKNKSYALVGASGSGKSTMLYLIGRFFDVDSGAIRIDGKDIRNMDQDELLSKMGIVFQENHLLNQSLRENITMGSNATDEVVLQALQDSGGDEILERMENGLETILGPEGTYVSGGEAQRIAIARALVRQAPILLLDEATAYADPENEVAIRKSLKKLREGKTTIMIAHRLNSVKDVDQIILLDKGHIIASGTHEELMEHSDQYRHLYKEYARSVEWRVANE